MTNAVYNIKTSKKTLDPDWFYLNLLKHSGPKLQRKIVEHKKLVWNEIQDILQSLAGKRNKETRKTSDQSFFASLVFGKRFTSHVAAWRKFKISKREGFSVAWECFWKGCDTSRMLYKLVAEINFIHSMIDHGFLELF